MTSPGTSFRQHFANVSRGASLGADRVPIVPAAADVAEWLLGGRSGRGVRICLIDSGVEYSHQDVPNAGTSYTVVESSGDFDVVETEELDVVGHGTACAGVIGRVAPEARIDSIRVLGPKNKGYGSAFLFALDWAIDQRYDIVNLSLSTRRDEHRGRLLALADSAAAAGVLLVCSAHNSPVTSYPWSLTSVISVGSHDGPNVYEVQMNPDPPVEFYGGGVGVSVPWLNGTTKIMSGNSFATPAIAANLARIVERFPNLRDWQYRQLLSMLATNVRRQPNV